MTAIVPTRRTRTVLRLPRLLHRSRLPRQSHPRRQPSPRSEPGAPADQGPGTPDVWLAGPRLGG
jgi:hypothetical protein